MSRLRSASPVFMLFSADSGRRANLHVVRFTHSALFVVVVPPTRTDGFSFLFASQIKMRNDTHSLLLVVPCSQKANKDTVVIRQFPRGLGTVGKDISCTVSYMYFFFIVSKFFLVDQSEKQTFICRSLKFKSSFFLHSIFIFCFQISQNTLVTDNNKSNIFPF